MPASLRTSSRGLRKSVISNTRTFGAENAKFERQRDPVLTDHLNRRRSTGRAHGRSADTPPALPGRCPRVMDDHAVPREEPRDQRTYRRDCRRTRRTVVGRGTLSTQGGAEQGPGPAHASGFPECLAVFLTFDRFSRPRSTCRNRATVYNCASPCLALPARARGCPDAEIRRYAPICD